MAKRGYEPRHGDAATRQRGHELETASVRGIVIFVVGLFVTLAALSGLLVALMHAFQPPGGSAQEAPVRVEAPVPTEGPRHWKDPPADFAAMSERQLDLLTSYGWTHPDRGIAHIPIEEAMRLLAERPELTPPSTRPTREEEPRGATP